MPSDTVDEKVERVIALFYDLRTEVRSLDAKVEEQFVSVHRNITRVDEEIDRFGSEVSGRFYDIDRDKWTPVQWAIIGVGGIAVTVLGGILALVFGTG